MALAALAVLAAILTPENRPQGGGLSSYSTGPDGASIAFELAQRMGWHASRRETRFDSTSTRPTVEVVVGPQQALGRHEVHRLLENVRRGGGLPRPGLAPGRLELWYRPPGRPPSLPA